MKKLYFFSLNILLLFLAPQAFAQPGNDAFANASLIASSSTCSTTSGTLVAATSDNRSVSPSCYNIAARDVWYKFIATKTDHTISLSNIGLGWNGSHNVYLQLYAYNTTTAVLTQLDCSTGGIITNTVDFTVNNTYYVRVHNNNTADVASTNFNICVTDYLLPSSRMGEVFSRTILSEANALQFPWEITYGPDDSLWVTESRGYKVYKISPASGAKRVVLDLSSTSTWFGNPGTGGLDTLYAQSMNLWTSWPQGGLAGLALHPKFGLNQNKDFVYLDYVWKRNGGTSPSGIIYQNKLVRFTYNNVNGRLENPVVLVAQLPGSSDHNSQRIIIAPVALSGPDFLFVASGDMGAGQFGNRYRPNNSQNVNSYEGKILRFNLESDGQAGDLQWIPNDNPYNASSAVWSIGMRNNQGFAYDASLNILYGSSHGPYSDDEINIIEGFKNYGHPLVVGYAADGNYNGTATRGTNLSVSAGATYKDCAITGYSPPVPPYVNANSFCGQSSIAPIGNELTNVSAINASGTGSYKDPIFSGYPSVPANILNIWQNSTGNNSWESEGWSGMDIYTNKVIPGWKKSLVSAGLKWGRLVRMKVDATGTKTLPSNIGGALGNVGDTVTYFQSSNRYRDLAFAPNGKDIFIVMDNNSATSGPGTANPTTPACPGCVLKYSFLGYGVKGSGFSSIPTSIAVAQGTPNTCNAGTSVTINVTNNSLWVPITGPDGNIMAEINAMGQNLGLITSSFYQNTNALRVNNGKRYLNRNITITPAVTSFGTPVQIRLYISQAEFDALDLDPLSNINSITDLRIHKNNDACLNAVVGATTILTAMNTTLADLQHGASGYVLQAAVASFSSFYFASNNIVLPVSLLNFSGTLQADYSSLLQWKAENQINFAGFTVERSLNGRQFIDIGYVQSIKGNGAINYQLSDVNAKDQSSLLLYYRLKMVDTDGSFKYSNIITIQLPATKAIVNIAPNPVQNELKGVLISPVTGSVTVRIFDNAGRMVSSSKIRVIKGSNIINQNLNQFSRGMYYLEISGEGINLKTKFEKL